LRTALLALALLSFAATPAAAELFVAQDLGTLGGDFSDAFGINSSGQVVGYSNLTPGGGTFVAFRTAPNGPIVPGLAPAGSSLGTFGGTFSQAFGVNDAGEAVGRFTSGGTTFGFRAAPGSPITSSLGLFAGGDFSEAYAINNAGQVTGRASVSAGGPSRAFRTTPGGDLSTATNLGTFAGGTFSEGYDINASGQVTGYADSAAAPNGHAFRTTAAGTLATATDLGSLGGALNFSQGFGINDAGDVVGYSSTTDGEFHAFLAPAAGGLVDLGTLGTGDFSQALAINNLGVIVGLSNLTPGGSVTRAFIFRDGMMIDLNTLLVPGSGLTLISASGINDAGQIVGLALNAAGEQHAFRLDPVAAIPEPAMLTLAGMGTLAVAAYGWRRRKRTA
jgi:probable HAF family extracellular repeat protein